MPSRGTAQCCFDILRLQTREPLENHDATTESRADPAIYHWGDYPKELQRLSRIATDLGHPTDLLAEGLRRAERSPSWFAQWR